MRSWPVRTSNRETCRPPSRLSEVTLLGEVSGTRRLNSTTGMDTSSVVRRPSSVVGVRWHLAESAVPR